MSKTEWIRMSERKPARLQVCDFLYAADAAMEDIWMLCRQIRGMLCIYTPDGGPIYWRPAHDLPADIEETMPVPATPDDVEELSPGERNDDIVDIVEGHYITRNHDAETPAPGCLICKHLNALMREARERGDYGQKEENR